MSIQHKIQVVITLLTLVSIMRFLVREVGNLFGKRYVTEKKLALVEEGTSSKKYSCN